jgi:hypothetical protein
MRTAATPFLTFEDVDALSWRVRSQFPGLRRGMRSLLAHTPDGDLAGEIRWRIRGGEIALVWVPEHLQRHGVATALFFEARRRQPDLHHSGELTADAQAWIDALEHGRISA